MADSVNPTSLPAGMDLYGAYDDGSYNNVVAVRQRFPSATVIAITVLASDNMGDCLDVENGDATPQDAPAWVQKRRLAGHLGPLVYCSEAIWPEVRLAFSNAGVLAPGYWIAAYPGIGPVIYPGAIGHQFIDHGAWDESVMVDYLPGIDPAPLPSAPDPKEKNVTSIVDDDGNLHVFCASPTEHLYEFVQPKVGGNWSVTDITAEIAQQFPNDPPFLVQA
jgi:hypothetical protein